MTNLNKKSENVSKALDALQNEVNKESNSLASFEEFIDKMFKKALHVLNSIAERAENHATSIRDEIESAEEVLKKYGRN